MFRQIRGILALSPKERVWVFLVLPASAVARAMILLVPFGWYAPVLGQRLGASEVRTVVDEEELARARSIGRVVRAVSRHVPWRCNCLPQALLAAMLCRRQRIPYVVHLGLKRGDDPEAPLRAHAWVCVGPSIIVGREGARAYTVVSTYLTPGAVPKVASGV